MYLNYATLLDIAGVNHLSINCNVYDSWEGNFWVGVLSWDEEVLSILNVSLHPRTTWELGRTYMPLLQARGPKQRAGVAESSALVAPSSPKETKCWPLLLCDPIDGDTTIRIPSLHESA